MSGVSRQTQGHTPQDAGTTSTPCDRCGRKGKGSADLRERLADRAVERAQDLAGVAAQLAVGRHVGHDAVGQLTGQPVDVRERGAHGVGVQLGQRDGVGDALDDHGGVLVGEGGRGLLQAGELLLPLPGVHTLQRVDGLLDHAVALPREVRLGHQDEVRDVGVAVDVVRAHLIGQVHGQGEADLDVALPVEDLLREGDVDAAAVAEREGHLVLADRRRDQRGHVTVLRQPLRRHLAVAALDLGGVLVVGDLLDLLLRAPRVQRVAVVRRVAGHLQPLLPGDRLLLAAVVHDREARGLVEVVQQDVALAVGEAHGRDRRAHELAHALGHLVRELPLADLDQRTEHRVQVAVQERALVVVRTELRGPQRALSIGVEVGGEEGGDQVLQIEHVFLLRVTGV